jgi:ABC-2 type transport system permease protein
MFQKLKTKIKIKIDELKNNLGVQSRYIVHFYLDSAEATGITNILSMGGTVLYTVTIVYLWHIKGSPSTTSTYLLVGRLYKALSENLFYGILANQIITGKLTDVLLRPINVMRYYFLATLGKRIFRNFIELIGFGVAILICVSFTQVNFIWQNIWLLVLFIPISYWINHFTGVLIGSLAFFIYNKTDYPGLESFYANIRTICSGLLIPLNLLPFSGFFVSLPFAFTLHHPTEMYLGSYSPLQVVYTFGGGIFWCIFLFYISTFVFKKGLKRNEAVGL